MEVIMQSGLTILAQVPFTQSVGPSVKGQLISKGLFKVFICTKKRTKIFLYFCLCLRKEVKSNLIKKINPGLAKED